MGQETIWDFLMRAAVAAAVIAIIVRFLLVRRADFVIRIRGEKIHFQGGFPLSQRAELTELLRELKPAGSAKIMGVRHGQRLRIWFSGSLSAGQQQRIRNFLLSGL
jgi:hypothetical protein